MNFSKESDKRCTLLLENELTCFVVRLIEETRKISEDTQYRRESILFAADVLAKHKESMSKQFAKMYEIMRSEYEATMIKPTYQEI